MARWILLFLLWTLGGCSAPRAASAPSVVHPASTSDRYLPTIVTAGPEMWRPEPGIQWQIQFTDLPVDTSVEAALYDIDLFDNDASVVAALQGRGRRVICYINVGAWEEWRPDADRFPPELLGAEYEGWPGERWLDIRRLDLLAPILRDRLDLCRARGFDGVEPDNMNGYQNPTGFPLTYDDQLVFNRWLAGEAHARGLAIGLKNDSEQVAELLPHFEWIITEGCFEQDWCDQARPFIEAGKPVLAIEYTDTGITLDDFCDQAATLGFSAILKHRALDAFRESCP